MKNLFKIHALSLGLALSLGACGDDGDEDTGTDGLTDGMTDTMPTTTDTPTTDTPTTDTPTTDTPTTGEPTTGEPTTGEPTTGEPTTGEPTTGEPTTGEPTTGDTDGTGTGTGGEALSFETDIYPIISDNCSCHVNNSPEGLAMPDAATAYGNLVGVGASQSDLNRVEAGDASQSYLWHKVNGTHDEAPANGEGARMPAQAGPLNQADIDTIADWIDDGAAE